MTEHPQLKYGMAEFRILRNDGISSSAKGGSYIELQFWVKYIPILTQIIVEEDNNAKYDVSTARPTLLLK